MAANPNNPGASDDLSITLKSSGISARVDSEIDAAARGGEAQRKIVLTAESLAPSRPAPPPPTAPTRVMPAPAIPPPVPPAKPTTNGFKPSLDRFKANPTPPGGAKEPWHIRFRKQLYIVGAVAAILFAIATFVFVKGLSEPESNKIAAEASGAIDPVNNEITDADTVNDFRKSSGAARRAASELTALQARAKREIGDEKERAALDKLLESELSLMQAYSGLAGLDRLKLSTTPKLVRSAENASRQLLAAGAAMQAVDREGAVDATRTSEAVNNMDEQLTNARLAMNKWKRKKLQRKRALERFRSDMGTLSSIKGTMDAQRNKVGDFYRTPYRRSYNGPYVSDFIRERESLLNQLRSTSLNPLLLSAKASLEQAMRGSINAFPMLESAWVQTELGETPENMPAFAAYDRATDAVDAEVRGYSSALSTAQGEAGRKYSEPPKPNV